MVIGVDLDNVLSRTTHTFLAWYNQLKGTIIQCRDVRAFDMSSALGITLPQLFSIWDDFYKSNDFAHLRPLPYAQDVIRQTKERHPLVVVTARPIILEPLTRQWLDRYFRDCFSNVVFSTDVNTSNRPNGFSRKKSEICLSTGIETLVEDGLEYALDCAEQGISVLLFDYPWNRKQHDPSIRRVYSWKEVGYLLNGKHH